MCLCLHVERNEERWYWRIELKKTDEKRVQNWSTVKAFGCRLLLCIQLWIICVGIFAWMWTENWFFSALFVSFFALLALAAFVIYLLRKSLTDQNKYDGKTNNHHHRRRCRRCLAGCAAPHTLGLNMKLFRVEESRSGQFVYFLCCCCWQTLRKRVTMIFEPSTSIRMWRTR